MCFCYKNVTANDFTNTNTPSFNAKFALLLITGLIVPSSINTPFRCKQEAGDNLSVCLLNLFPEINHPAKFTGHKSCNSGNINFSNYHVISHWSRYQMIMWLEGWKPRAENQHHVLFGVHGFSGDGDIMYLICHASSHDHLIKGSCRLMGGSSLRYVITVIRIETVSILILEI